MIHYRSSAGRFLLLAGALLAACSTSRVAAPAAIDIQPAEAHAPRRSGLDVENYSLDLEIFPEERRLEGTATLRFAALSEPLVTLELDLAGLTVERVFDVEGEDLVFRTLEGRLEIDLAEPLAPGDLTQVSIRYGGRPATGLWFTAVREGVPTQVFTQGECEDARFWFPCLDSPSDRATSEVRVRMPAGWVATAAGERLDRLDLGDGTVREHWRMSEPHPAYLMTLVAGEFEVLRDEWNGVPLTYLVPAEYADLAEDSLADTPAALEFLSRVTGLRYPYAKYSQACVEGFPFGGMENISATTLTDQCLRDEHGLRDQPATGLVVHEAAHQWFGDLMTCNDWSHVWLNEGFATYFTNLFFEEHEGVDSFRARMRRAQEAYMKADVGEQRRPIVHDVYRDPMDLFTGGHAYPGGASRLHLLRFVLGDEAFFDGIELYVAENRGRGVVTEDLRRAMERTSGRDLGRFFAQWLYTGGFPEFEVSWRWDEDEERVLLSVGQVQSTADGTPAVFETPVDVEVRVGDDAEIHRIELTRRDETFALPAAGQPTWVRFDKYGWIPGKVAAAKTVDEWFAIAALDDDVNGRRDALTGLAELAIGRTFPALRRSCVETLAELLEFDDSGWIREEAAGALAKLLEANVRRARSARGALLRAASGDAKASVRVASLKALAGFGLDPELAAFGREQFDAGYSWETQGAAAGLVCSSEGVHEALRWLRARISKRESPHGTLQSHLIPHLVTLLGPRSRPVLLDLADDGSLHPVARRAAIRALSEVAVGDPSAGRRLLGLLDEPSLHLRRAAIDTLGAVGTPAVLAPLEAHYRRCVFPRERRSLEDVFRKPWAGGVRGGGVGGLGGKERSP